MKPNHSIRHTRTCRPCRPALQGRVSPPMHVPVPVPMPIRVRVRVPVPVPV